MPVIKKQEKHKMKTHTDKKFEAQAKNKAKMFDEVGDPLIFDSIKINKSGKKEAFFHDSKCVYCVDEDLEFNYVCAR